MQYHSQLIVLGGQFNDHILYYLIIYYFDSSSIPLDGGDVATFNWVADENGYRVESPHLPTPPPTPQHVAQLLRIAEEQRAAGVTFD